jgi:hypothetical protein
MSLSESALGQTGERALFAFFLGAPLVLFCALSRPPAAADAHAGTAFSTRALWARNALVFLVSVTFPAFLIGNMARKSLWFDAGGFAGLVVSLPFQAAALLPALARLPTRVVLAVVPRRGDAPLAGGDAPGPAAPPVFIACEDERAREALTRALAAASAAGVQGVSLGYLRRLVGRFPLPCASCPPEPEAHVRQAFMDFVARESKPPAPRFAEPDPCAAKCSYSALLAWSAKFPGARAAATSKVCYNIVKPQADLLPESEKLAYYSQPGAPPSRSVIALHFRDPSFTGGPMINIADAELGPVTTFVSHAWSESFPELVAALESHALVTEETGALFSAWTAGFNAYFRQTGSPSEPPLLVERPKRYWIDLFNKDQVAANPKQMGLKGDALQAKIDEYSRNTEVEFKVNLAACGSTEFIANGLSTGEYGPKGPPALSRTWCLYEIFHSLKGGGKLALLQRAQDVADPAEFYPPVIQMENAQAEMAQDKVTLDSSIQKSVGFAAVNAAVVERVKLSQLTFVRDLENQAATLQKAAPSMLVGAVLVAVFSVLLWFSFAGTLRDGLSSVPSDLPWAFALLPIAITSTLAAAVLFVGNNLQRARAAKTLAKVGALKAQLTGGGGGGGAFFRMAPPQQQQQWTPPPQQQQWAPPQPPPQQQQWAPQPPQQQRWAPPPQQQQQWAQQHWAPQQHFLGHPQLASPQMHAWPGYAQQQVHPQVQPQMQPWVGYPQQQRRVV